MNRSAARQTTDLLVACGLVAVGTILLGPVAGSVVAGVGTEMLAGVTERGWTRLRDRYLGGQGILDADLQAAMRRAFSRAVQQLERMWWVTPRGYQQQRDPDKRAEVEGLFAILREDADQILTDQRLRTITGDAEALRALGSAPETRRSIARFLDVYLLGHDDQLGAFLRTNLVPELARTFADEMLAHTEAGNRAWRAHQRLVEQSLQAGIIAIQETQQLALDQLQQLAEAVRALQAWSEQLAIMPDQQREPTGESGLVAVIGNVRDQIIDAVAAESGLTRDAAELAFDQTHELIAAAESRIRADIAALRPDDLERLRQLTERTTNRTAEYAKIRVGAAEVRINRACAAALRRMASDGSFVVVGEPGAGKSGALHDLVTELQREGREVVFLTVDGIAAESAGELRTELGLSRDLPDVLRDWVDTRPGFLVIDALDAARSERAARTLRDLIESVGGLGSRWQIIASIRKFDLRYSSELQQWFEGEPDAVFRDPEFMRVRHLNVPRLTDQELDQVSNQAQELLRLMRGATPLLMDLLRVPFNLRLAGELLGSGIALGELTAIRSQLGLLNSYWLHRVIRADGQRDAREWVLERTADQMVRARQLRVPRRLVATDPAASPALEDVLSTHVLAEWQRTPNSAPESDFLSFAHHLLFDYAVARLVLRPLSGGDLVRLLSQQRDLVIAVRPSLTLHFQHLWEIDDTRSAFWSEVLTIARAEGVPEIGKLIGPEVARAATRLLDLEPLIVALNGGNLQGREAATRALRHLINALLAVPDPSQHLVGMQAGPWCELLEHLSQTLSPSLAAALRPLLPDLYRHPERFTETQCLAAGHAARRLLEYAWRREPRDGWLVTTAMQAVCRTFGSDPSASAELIRYALEPEHMAQHAYEELPKLASEVGRLVSFDPKLVGDIYCAAFAHVETGRETTHMGGRIMAFRSDRRQDYDLALHILKEAYPDLLTRAPREALRVLEVVIDRYLLDRHSVQLASLSMAAFNFEGTVASIRYDLSRRWDGRRPLNDRDPNELLTLLQNHLTELADDGDLSQQRRAFLQVLIAEPRPAAVWRRLLFVGASRPKTLGLDIRPAAWALPILLGADTTAPSCAFLRSLFPLLDPDERKQTEDAVLAIPSEVPTSNGDMGQRVRNRVLGCLPSSELVTAEAKQLLISRDEDESTATKLEANEHWDQDEPDVMIRDATDDPEPQGLDRQVLQSIVQYIESRPATLETNRALDIQSELAVLRAELSSDNVRDLPTHRHEQAWGRLAEACKLIASQPDLRCDDSLGAFVRSILLEAVEYPSRPEPDGNYDSEYVMVPTCKPRAEAAEGLLWLAAHSTFLDSVTLDVIEGLADDPDPAVRLQIAAKVNLLAASAPKLVWSVLERLGAEERLPGLLHLMVCGPLLAVSRLDADRAAAIARAVYERQSDEEEDFVRNDCVSVFLDLYLRFDHESSRDVLFAIANSAVEHPGEVAHIARHLRAALTAGPVVPAEPFAEAVRARAFGLLEAVLRSAEEINRRLREAMRAGQSNPPSELERHHIEALMKISGTISQEVYFASGAYAERHEDDGDRVSDEVKHRFLREAGPVLDKLGGFGFPQTAHSLLETLDAYVAMDPMGVFERVGRVVCVSREYGYQYEQLANNLVVGLVQRYLASYPADVRQNTASQSTLIEILDTFTDVGWPSALRLAYQLEQIYR